MGRMRSDQGDDKSHATRLAVIGSVLAVFACLVGGLGLLWRQALIDTARYMRTYGQPGTPEVLNRARAYHMNQIALTERGLATRLTEHSPFGAVAKKFMEEQPLFTKGATNSAYIRGHALPLYAGPDSTSVWDLLVSPRALEALDPAIRGDSLTWTQIATVVTIVGGRQQAAPHSRAVGTAGWRYTVAIYDLAKRTRVGLKVVSDDRTGADPWPQIIAYINHLPRR